MSQGTNRSSSSMKRGEELEPPIPTDLIMEIFSRLPGKSIARFRCVSKLWGSMFRSSYFTELFLTRSSALPRLLFVLKNANDEWSIFSTPQPHNLCRKSSLVLAADFHMKLYGVAVGRLEICGYASGLIYFPDMWMSKEDEDTFPVICNPTTGLYATLPKLIRYRKRSRSVLGFDPIDKQFKVLAETYPYYNDGEEHHKILTLGTGKLRWRSKVECPGYNYSLCQGICINGVCYYLVEWNDVPSCHALLCVDVRSEEFKLIDAECFSDQYRIKLINYKGRLGGISSGYVGQLCICVLEDAETQEWSKRVYSLEKNALVNPNSDYVAGVTASGEIVLTKHTSTRPFYVYYFNPETNTFQSFEIQGFEDNCGVNAFVDHVEDINVNDVKHLKSRPVKPGPDIIPPKPQKRHTSRDLCKSAPSVNNKHPTVLLQNKYDLLANLE